MNPELRIVVVGQSGPYAPPLLARLAATRGPWRVVGVVEGRRRQAGGPLHRTVLPRRDSGLSPQSLSAVAAALELPTFQTRDINDSAAIRYLQTLDGDILLCAGFDRLFKPPVLESVSWGGLNLHPSALPEWRGPAPLFWALREGRSSITVTVHRLEAGEDNGEIYGSASFRRRPRMRGEDLYRASIDCVFPIVVRTLRSVAAGALQGVPQDDTQASRAPRPSPEDAYIDPNVWGCEQLTDFAVAATFFCAPWLQLGGERFWVRGAATPGPGESLPGHYAVVDDLLVVNCVDGLARLEVARR
ncbi:MAG: formyltransferase family protein [Myxococcota bacterium]